jgi:hypothetical protein
LLLFSIRRQPVNPAGFSPITYDRLLDLFRLPTPT